MPISPYQATTSAVTESMRPAGRSPAPAPAAGSRGHARRVSPVVPPRTGPGAPCGPGPSSTDSVDRHGPALGLAAAGLEALRGLAHGATAPGALRPPGDGYPAAAPPRPRAEAPPRGGARPRGHTRHQPSRRRAAGLASPSATLEVWAAEEFVPTRRQRSMTGRRRHRSLVSWRFGASALLALLLASSAFAEDRGEIRVKVVGLKSDQGVLRFGALQQEGDLRDQGWPHRQGRETDQERTVRVRDPGRALRHVRHHRRPRRESRRLDRREPLLLGAQGHLQLLQQDPLVPQLRQGEVPAEQGIGHRGDPRLLAE